MHAYKAREGEGEAMGRGGVEQTVHCDKMERQRVEFEQEEVRDRGQRSGVCVCVGGGLCQLYE